MMAETANWPGKTANDMPNSRRCGIHQGTYDRGGTDGKNRWGKDAIGFPTNFDNIAPTARTLALAQSSAPGRLVSEFRDIRAQANILRSVRGSLRSAASGINCYLLFGDAMGAPATPITQAEVRRWGATFNPWQTCGLYSNHIRKAGLLIGNAPTWRSAEIGTLPIG